MTYDVRDPGLRHPAPGNSGMAFSTVSEGTPATSTQPNPRPDITCHKCGKLGHFSTTCAEVNHANGTVLGAAAGEVVMAHIGSTHGGDDSDGSFIDEFCFLVVHVQDTSEDKDNSDSDGGHDLGGYNPAWRLFGGVEDSDSDGSYDPEPHPVGGVEDCNFDFFGTSSLWRR
jgi:hypothetical protein